MKWAALLTMTVDHLGAVFGWSGWDLIPFAVSQPMRIIGRAAFPLYAFGVAAGWQRTRSRTRYFTNLAACAFFSQLPFTLALYGPNLRMSGGAPLVIGYRAVCAPLAVLLAGAVFWLFRSRAAAGWTLAAAALAGLQLKAGGTWLLAPGDLNVLYTLALAAACLGVWQCWRSWTLPRRAAAAAALAAGLLCFGLPADYGTGLAGVLLVVGLAVLGRSARPGPAQAAYVLAWGAAFYGCYQHNWPMLAGLVLPAALIGLAYRLPHPARPRRGWKRLFYAYYPAHLLVLGLASAAVRTQG